MQVNGVYGDGGPVAVQTAATSGPAAAEFRGAEFGLAKLLLLPMTTVWEKTLFADDDTPLDQPVKQLEVGRPWDLERRCGNDPRPPRINGGCCRRSSRCAD